MDGYVILAFLLASIGLVILIVEMFIPTAGMLGILSATCFAGAFYCAWRAWYQTGQYFWWWGFVFGILLLIPSVITGGVYWMPRTKFGRELFIAPQLLTELEPFQEEEAQLRKLLNQRGKATTMFSPGGMVQVGSHRFHAESEGLVIDPEAEVVVVAIKGNRLVVRPAGLYDSAPSQPEVSSLPLNEDAVAEQRPKPAASSIDFDFGENE